MSEPRHWIDALLVTGMVGFTIQGHADDGGKPRDEPPPDGSISKTGLHAGQEGESLLKPTAWRALKQGYRGDGSVFSCDNGANARGRRGVLQRIEDRKGPPTFWRQGNVGGQFGRVLLGSCQTAC